MVQVEVEQGGVERTFLWRKTSEFADSIIEEVYSKRGDVVLYSEDGFKCYIDRVSFSFYPRARCLQVTLLFVLLSLCLKLAPQLAGNGLLLQHCLWILLRLSGSFPQLEICSTVLLTQIFFPNSRFSFSKRNFCEA